MQIRSPLQGVSRDIVRIKPRPELPWDASQRRCAEGRKRLSARRPSRARPFYCYCAGPGDVTSPSGAVSQQLVGLQVIRPGCKPGSSSPGGSGAKRKARKSADALAGGGCDDIPHVTLPRERYIASSGDTQSLYSRDSAGAERAFDKSGRIHRQRQPWIAWFDASGWRLARFAVAGGYLCNPETSEGPKEQLEPLNMLVTWEAIARLRNEMFSSIEQNLGELETICVDILRKSCLGITPR